LENAHRDFILSDIEKDIIATHMFPLNLGIPSFKESVVVNIADKICSLYETLPFFKIGKKIIGNIDY